MGSSKWVKELNGWRFLPALVIFLTLGVGITLGTLVSQGVRASKNTVAPKTAPMAQPSPIQLSASFAVVASTVEPAVVNINTETKVKATSRRFRGDPQGPHEFFERFFGTPEGAPRKQTNLGSGVIVDEQGYILTNHHVVVRSGAEEPVDRIRVRLHGKDQEFKEYDAKVIGTDRSTDLAVIKVDVGRALPAVEFGDSESMRVGDWVLAVGSPFGLRSTVTAGIISAKGRDIEPGPRGQFKHYIQTDAAINPGNSGGPLVNLEGRIIGINTAIFTSGRGYDGVGFAIPSNTARKVYNALIKTGRVTRGSIGITFRSDENEALLRSFGAEHGFVVQQVEPDSPADRAGLRRGDVIQAINGKMIRNSAELINTIAETPIGDTVQIQFLRDEKKVKANVEVADRTVIFADLLGTRREKPGETPSPDRGKLGVRVRDLTPNQAEELANQLQLGPAAAGVLVVEVAPDGFGYEELGLRRQQVILEINRKEIGNAADFRREEGALASGQDVLILIARRGPSGFQTAYLAATMP